MIFALVLIVSYLLGSITTGDIVARIRKVNLRGQGSGNVGATNVFRVMGATSGIIVLVADALKGVVAVLLGYLVPEIPGLAPEAFTGLFAVIGHSWPIYTGFKGGKGVATGLGVVIALTPAVLPVVAGVWLLVFFIFGYVSLASVLAAFAYPVTVWFLYSNGGYLLTALVISVLIIFRHKDNIKRLLRGEENRILYKNRDKRGALK